MQGHGQRGGHLGAEIEAVVGQAGFKQQHGNVGVFREPRGQRVAGAAGADDDVVVGGFEDHVSILLQHFSDGLGITQQGRLKSSGSILPDKLAGRAALLQRPYAVIGTGAIAAAAVEILGVFIADGGALNVEIQHLPDGGRRERQALAAMVHSDGFNLPNRVD